MKRLIIFLSLLAFVIVGAMAFVPAASAKKIVVKFGHVAPPFHGQHQGCLAFAKYVGKKTKGKIDIKVFPMGQLGGERSMAEQVQAGTLQLAAITTAVLSNFVPQAALIDLPFIFPDRKTAYKVLDDVEFMKKFFPYFTPKGFIALGWTENEFRDMTNSKRPIRKPADLKGLKIRVMESPVYLDTFKQLGVQPVPMPFPEVYNALQQGVIDGQDNPLLTSVLMKFTEVNKYVTITHHILTECVIVANPDFWKTLSKKEKKIMRDAAKTCIKTNRKVNAALYKNKIWKIVKAKHIKVTKLTPAERAAFKKAMTPVYKKYEKIVGPDLFSLFEKKIKYYSTH
jgi:tripartite ATP-independent transporter DctP family solute receptor